MASKLGAALVGGVLILIVSEANQPGSSAPVVQAVVNGTSTAVAGGSAIAQDAAREAPELGAAVKDGLGGLASAAGGLIPPPTTVAPAQDWPQQQP